MKCSDCGYENMEGSKFCKKCGTELEVPQTPKFCTGCGKAVVEGHLYCVGCGKPIQPMGTIVPPVEEEIVQLNMMNDSVKENETSGEKKTPKNLVIGIVIGVIVVALIIAGVWVISNNDPGNDKNNDDNTQEKVTQTEEQLETQVTENVIIEETQVQETETQIQETETQEVVLGILDYQTICMNLMETESAYGSVNEKMSVDMAQTIVSANIAAAGTSYCMKDISTMNQEMLIYRLAYPFARSLFGEEEIRYNLQDYRQELEGTEYDLTYAASVYKKDDFIKVVEAFCPYITHSQSMDYGEYIGFGGGDGDAWYYFDAYDIKENENYIMVKAACYQGNNGGGENVYQYSIKVLFEKTPDSILGMRAVYVEGYADDMKQNIFSITASSQLPDYKEKTYAPQNMIDGDYGTPWVENVESVGIGETIQIALNNKMWVQEFVLYNGYQASEEQFYKNGYVTKIYIDFGNGVTKELDCTGYYTGTDRDFATFNKLSLDRPIYTDAITVTILGAEAGSKYADTCISEIELH